MGDLLVRIDEQVGRLRKDLDRVSNGVGFPRCAERLQRIEGMGHSIESVRNSYIWLRNLVVSGLVALLLAIGAKTWYIDKAIMQKVANTTQIEQKK